MTYARLLYIGVTLLHRSERDVQQMPLGELLDQWELYRQYNGLAKPFTETAIDDIIPEGLM